MIPVDKQLHLMGGYIITITLMPFGFAWAIGLCAFIAAAKELLWDLKMGRGTPEWMDWYATVGGGFLGAVAFMLLSSFSS